MRRFLTLLLFAVAAMPVAAQSQQQTQQAAQANAPAKDPLDKIVCERQEQLGSRLGGRKVCKTVGQWAEQRDVQRHDFEKVQQVVNQSPGH